MSINCYDGTYGKEQLKTWSKKGILTCPACGNPYEYCHGRVKTPYFRHKDKNICEDKYSEAETQEHLNGKRDLFEWIKTQKYIENPILEGWLPDTKQRPDIMFDYKGKKYVIEYQCTPISSEYFERHELYQVAGINDIWICGIDKYMKKNMRTKTIEEHCSGYYSPHTKTFAFSKNDKYPIYELLLEIDRNSKTNLKDEWNFEFKFEEDERYYYYEYISSQLSNLKFDERIIFGNIKDAQYQLDLNHQKQIERRERKIINKKSNKNIYDYLTKSIDEDKKNIFGFYWTESVYKDELVLENSVYLNTKYGNPNRIYESFDMNVGIYLSACKCKKRYLKLVKRLSNIEQLIDKKLQRVRKQSSQIILITHDEEINEDIKYFNAGSRISPVYRYSYPSECDFLSVFLDAILKFKNNQKIYIKLPRKIDTLFGVFDLCKCDKTIFYFNRLGIKNVQFYNEAKGGIK